MSTESVIARLGRLIAGMAHAAIDSAEGAQPIAVLEQSIREIEAAADDVRVELGKATAERHRLQHRRNELSSELMTLDDQVKVAVRENRDDLASVGIDRQLDIEAQVRVLDTLIADVDDKITKASDMLEAVKASRKEAEQRLYEFRHTERVSSGDAVSDVHALDALSKAQSRVEKAEAATTRVTGVPGAAPKKDVQAIEALKALSREHAVKERLARIKATADEGTE
ncbi:MAG: PspA/IM30 family protein [Methylobacteriaceae bacterium]|nr:PspA/IM30 family protein [Methylobacteriaceae bacterium]